MNRNKMELMIVMCHLRLFVMRVVKGQAVEGYITHEGSGLEANMVAELFEDSEEVQAEEGTAVKNTGAWECVVGREPGNRMQTTTKQGSGLTTMSRMLKMISISIDMMIYNVCALRVSSASARRQLSVSSASSQRQVKGGSNGKVSVLQLANNT